ncbi:roadblock/LC7 domain-containing protein [Streptomyces sp. bgisy060]|uniref:roadblock/LC7 domain-containing protein n=1 Tax=Streptomyces sp. bgisy060 TaxID=3413775 RepID=UPI003EBB7226
MSQYTKELSPLGQMLADFVDHTPGAVASVLVTSDGLVDEFHGLPEEGADTLAAAVSGIASLANGVFRDAPGEVQQSVVEHDSGTLFVMRAKVPPQVKSKVGSLLAVLTNETADAGVVGYEMLQWIERMHEHLLNPVRTATRPVQ